MIGAMLAAATFFLLVGATEMTHELVKPPDEGEFAGWYLIFSMFLFGIFPLLMYILGIALGAFAVVSVAMGVFVYRQKLGRTLEVLAFLMFAAQLLTALRNVFSGWDQLVPCVLAAAASGLFAWFVVLTGDQTDSNDRWVVREIWFGPTILLAARLVFSLVQTFFFSESAGSWSSIWQAGQGSGLFDGYSPWILTFYVVLMAAVFFACLWMRAVVCSREIPPGRGTGW